MRRWEWVFPILAVALPAWATLPDVAHFCGFWEWSLMCGLGAIFRFDILLPSIAVVAIWGWVRTALVMKDLRELTYLALALRDLTDATAEAIMHLNEGDK